MMGIEQTWLGICHLRSANDGPQQHRKALAAVYCRDWQTFDDLLRPHVEARGLSLDSTEEVLTADSWQTFHPNHPEAAELAQRVNPNQPVAVGRLMMDDGESGPADEPQTYLEITEIAGVEPLDMQLGAHPRRTVPDALREVLFGQPEPSESEIRRYGTAQAVPPMKTFAILDAAKVQHLPMLLDDAQLRHGCLFTGEESHLLGEVAPYLVELDEDISFTRALFTHNPNFHEDHATVHMWHKEPGLYLRSRDSFTRNLSHFREIARVADDDGKPVFFRFYEPSVAISYLEGNRTNAALINLIFRHANNIPDVYSIIALSPCQRTFRSYVPSSAAARVARARRLTITRSDTAIFEASAHRRLPRELSAWLLRLDQHRFRPFGQARLGRLSTHAVQEGARFGFRYKEEFAYLLYMMTYLGGWFHESALYQDFLPDLNDPTDARMSNLGNKFVHRFNEMKQQMASDQQIMQILGAQLDKLIPCADDGGRASRITSATLHDLDARLGKRDTELLWRFVARVSDEAAAWRFDEFQKAAHLGLSLALGFRYCDDPMYPWAFEHFRKNKEPDMTKLLQFGRKRLRKAERLAEAKK